MPYNPIVPAYDPVSMLWRDGIIFYPEDFANDRADTITLAVAASVAAIGGGGDLPSVPLLASDGTQLLSPIDGITPLLSPAGV